MNLGSASWRRAFAAFATVVLVALMVGAAQGSSVFFGHSGTCPGYGGYSGYGGYGGYGCSYGGYSNPGPLPGTHFTQTPPSTTTSRDATFAWEADSPPPAGTQWNYDCRLDGVAVHDPGSGFECHSPKSFSGLSVGAHEFRVAVAGKFPAQGPPAVYRWEIVEEQGGGGNGGGQGPPETTPAPVPAPPPGVGGGSGPDTIPPKVGLGFPRGALGDLAKILKDGYIPIVVSCDEPCSIDASALIQAALAKRLGIARTVRIGRGKAILKKAGKVTVKVKLTKKARKKLKRAKKVKVTLKVVVRDLRGNTRSGSRTVTIKRKPRRR